MLRRLTTVLAAAFLLASTMVVGAAASGSIDIVGTQDFGRIDGVDFTRHDCRFAGVADALPYTRADGNPGSVAFDVHCSIVLPTNPADWNGHILVEPIDAFVVPTLPETGEPNRFLWLTDDVVFGGPGDRWGYASISHFGGVASDQIDQPSLPNVNAAASLEILADFATALRSGGGSGLIGGGTSYRDVQGLAATGFSNSAIALRSIMGQPSPYGDDLFEGSLLMAAATQTAVDATGTFLEPAFGALDFGDERVLFLNSETEVAANGTFDSHGFVPVFSSIPLRVEADGVDRFLYEVAGAAHIDPVNGADLEAIGAVAPGTFASSNTLDWQPVIRAVFSHLRDWITDGTQPPESRLIDTPATPAPSDPAYPGHPSVVEGLVSRDENLNAQGGVRLPNVELGVGTYFAVGAPVDLFAPDVEVQFLTWLAGGFEDLSCEPLADGSVRFKNHGRYVSSFVKETKRLEAEGFLLKSDAQAMRIAAAQSDIGKCK